LTFVSRAEDGLPKGGKPSLEEREDILLSLDDTLVEICLILDEEGLEIGGVNVGRALMTENVVRS
jgi:hypothetical protein